MKLIFAQGNPGAPYARTRHNAGFILLDQLANQHNTTWKKESKFNAEIATITLHDEKVLLVKPLSFYNETGHIARSVVDFYKLTPSADVLVIHDELALPFGTIRVRQQGSDAGNNGIKSLNAHLGPTYWRLRIGIYTERRDLMPDADFVLSVFSADELTHLHTTVFTAIQPLISAFITNALAHSSHTITKTDTIVTTATTATTGTKNL